MKRSTHVSCSGCSSTWTGLNKAHCVSCHQTFGGVSGFDKHRKNGECLDPSIKGMRLQDDVWVRSGTEITAASRSERFK